MTSNNGSTALVQRVEETAAAVPALSGGSEAFQVAQRMAKALSASSIVPKDYQGNIANVMVAMEYANRLGASVLAVMQNLDLIHGRPALRATFLMGTVNASGRFSPIRYRWQGEGGTDGWGCRAVAVDRETGEECVGPLITIGLAKAEGWYNKSGSKWKTIPELMLMYRAGAWWARVYCPELALGLHTTDEVEDIGPAPRERAREVAAALDAPDAELERTSGRDVTPEPEPEGDQDDDVEFLQRKLFAAMKERAPHLATDKDQRRQWQHRLTGHASIKRMDAPALRKLIDAVQRGDTDPEETLDELQELEELDRAAELEGLPFDAMP